MLNIQEPYLKVMLFFIIYKDVYGILVFRPLQFVKGKQVVQL